MAFMCYDNFCKSLCFISMSTKHRKQDEIFNQLKLKVNEKYLKDEKISTNIEPSNDEAITN